MTPDQKIQYENQGFLHLPGVIPQELVRRLKQAFDAEAARHHLNGAPFLDLPHILDVDDAFVDVADLPTVVPTLLEAVGPDIQLNHTHARLFPPGKTFTAPWHSDLADVIGVDLGHSPHFFVKVHYYFEDLTPDQGCLAFLPGTHRLPAGYPRPQIEDIESSPAVTKIVPKAGDAVIFNTHVLHMAMDNTSPRTRKSLIYAYSHFWLKQYPNAVPIDLERHATSAFRRQLFGVEQEGLSYFDHRVDRRSDSKGTYSSLRLASGRVLRRFRGQPVAANEK